MDTNQPIVLRDMGSFMFGGTVTPRGGYETFHGDHGYAQYFIPEDARDYPVVMWHGLGQSGKCWETTVGGQDGMWQTFVKNDYAVYIIDQARRGRAGWTMAPKTPDAPKRPVQERESSTFSVYRIGEWDPPMPARVYKGSQFVKTPEAVEQFFRQETDDTADAPETPEYRELLKLNMIDLLEQAGPSILFTHSNSGQYGWETAMSRPDLVKGIICYEPGNTVFPEGEHPGEIPSKCKNMINAWMMPPTVSKDRWMNLTKVPIVILFGDYITDVSSEVFGTDAWRVSRIYSQFFADAINANGGNAKVIELPKIGIKGNTHNGIGEKNIKEIAKLYLSSLEKYGLATKNNPNQGPKFKKLPEHTIWLANDIDYREGN